MKKTLRLRREDLFELAAADLEVVRGGSTPLITDGHHCFGSSLCAPASRVVSACGCPQPVSVFGGC